jgi:hypothetical protein
MDLVVLTVVAIVALAVVAVMWLNRVWDGWWQRRRIRTYVPRRYREAGEPAPRTLNPGRGSGPVRLPLGGPGDTTYPLPVPLPIPPPRTPPPAIGRVRLVKRVTLTRRNSRRY